MDLAVGVVVAEEVDGRQDRDGVLLVVDAREGDRLRVDVVCERLVADLQESVREYGYTRAVVGRLSYPG